MKARKVIRLFGNEEKLAELLGCAPSTVYRWDYPRSRGGCGGYVPTKRIPELLKLAKKQGITLADD